MIRFTMASGQTFTTSEYVNIDEFTVALREIAKSGKTGYLGAYRIWIPTDQGDYVCFANVCSFTDTWRRST